jgi:diacylglycerol kinase family enzyme
LPFCGRAPTAGLPAVLHAAMMPLSSTAPVRVILNAHAGTAGAAGGIDVMTQKFRDRGVDAQVVHVQSGEHIVREAADAVRAGAGAVVAGGGDGTVSAVAAELAGTPVPLGVLPLGTLNHFAKDMGIPLDVDEAVAVIAQGRVAPVDVGEVNGKVFINNSSLGLYPDIVLDREQQRNRLGRGKWTALLSACVRALQRYPVLSLHIDADGEGLARRSAFAFIGNNEYAMEGFNIGARTSLNAGRLSLYVTQRTGRFGLLRLALRALLGKLRQARDFDALTASRLRVDTAKRRVRVATDGEVSVMQAPLEYRIRPAALRVFVPQRSPEGAAG